MDTKKDELYLCVQMPNTPEYRIVVFSDVNEGLKEEMHNVCDVDEVTFFQCARMVLDGTLLEKDYDPFWHYYLSYAYFRIREENGATLMDFYETCKSILRLFKDNWFGCADDKKQRRYESALELLEGWKAEIEKMDDPDLSLLFKDVPQRRKTNAKGWENFLRSQNSETGNMEEWEKLLGQEKSDTDKGRKSTINQHLAKILDEIQAIENENPQEMAEIRRRARKKREKASFEAWGRFLDKANKENSSNVGKIKSKKQPKEVNFRDLIQYPDKEKLITRLHELIDGKRSADIGSVLLYAFQIQYYLARKPTRAEFESEFKYTGTWSGIHKYMMADNDAMMERANRIIIFPDEELRQSKKKK